MDKGKSNLVSKCKIVSKENGCNKNTDKGLSTDVGRRSQEERHEDVTNNNGDGKERLSDSGGGMPKQFLNKEDSAARTNGKNTATGKSCKEANKNQTKASIG